jgi:hypothetical protein
MMSTKHEQLEIQILNRVGKLEEKEGKLYNYFNDLQKKLKHKNMSNTEKVGKNNNGKTYEKKEKLKTQISPTKSILFF